MSREWIIDKVYQVGRNCWLKALLQNGNRNEEEMQQAHFFVFFFSKIEEFEGK